eukprot:XP_016661621.1 PREDICTED: uncharacterized protein LOC100574153 [Acyrthosiphon pisum]
MSCCVPSCAHKGESTFGVPKDIDQLNLWNVRIGIDLKPSSRVCSNHFDHKDVIKTWESGQGTSKYTVCLKRARLCEGTIPENITLGLGLNNSFIYVATQEWNNTPLTKKRKKFFGILKQVSGPNGHPTVPTFYSYIACYRFIKL